MGRDMLLDNSRRAWGEFQLTVLVLAAGLSTHVDRLRRDERGEGGGNSLVTLLLIVAGVAAAIGLGALVIAAFNSRSTGLNPETGK